MPAATRLALYYGCAFLLVGVQLPFWPLWLAGRGLGASEIGFVLAFALWVKVAVNPLIGIAADRSGRRKAVMVALSVLNLAGFLLFLSAERFWAILVINALTTAAASAIMR